MDSDGLAVIKLSSSYCKSWNAWFALISWQLAPASSSDDIQYLDLRVTQKNAQESTEQIWIQMRLDTIINTRLV